MRHTDLLLRANIPVICEKPAGLSIDEAERIAYVADQSGIECRANFQLRSHPLVRQAWSLTDANPPSEIVIACSSSARRSRSGKPSWYWQRAAGGGVWFSLLPHLADLAYHLGAPPQAVMVTRALPRAGPDRGIDAIVVQALCRDKRKVTLIADPMADATSFTISFRNAAGIELAVFDLAANGANPWLTAFSACVDTVLRDGHSIDLRACATLQDAARAHRLIRAARASIASGTWAQVTP